MFIQYKLIFLNWISKIRQTTLPDELEGLLRRFGVKNIEMAGPGAYARTVPHELLVKIMNDSKQRSENVHSV